MIGARKSAAHKVENETATLWVAKIHGLSQKFKSPRKAVSLGEFSDEAVFPVFELIYRFCLCQALQTKVGV